jgi:hypothetical protein
MVTSNVIYEKGFLIFAAKMAILTALENSYLKERDEINHFSSSAHQIPERLVRIEGVGFLCKSFKASNAEAFQAK